MNPPASTHRLGRDGRRAYLADNGAFVGLGVALLERNAHGSWRPRPRADLERLLAIGIGTSIDLSWRMIKLASVARALNAGDRSLAAIALVQAELPPLADETAARRMAKADGVAKAYDRDEPRGEHGRWTTRGASQTAQADTGTMSDASPAWPSTAKRRSVQSLSLSDAGTQFLQAHEAGPNGPNLSVYLDQKGNPTIGYGHRLKAGESYPDGISDEEADRLLARDVADAEDAVRRNVKVDLTQAQFDALVSFTYNEGPRHLAGSTLLQHVNANDFDGAAKQFGAWDKLTVNRVLVTNRGLAARRASERRLFVEGEYR